MAIIQTLTKEHRILESVLDRLESALQLEPQLAVSELRDALLHVLPALERHEQAEALLFHEGSDELARCDGQRQAAEQLAMDLLAAVQREDCQFPALAASARRLCAVLREHFKTEENELFKVHGARAVRSLSKATAAQAAVLERELQASWPLLTEYAQAPLRVGG